MKSEFKSINVKDFLMGLLYALVIGLAGYFMDANVSGVEISLTAIISVALSALVGYLTKTFYTNSEGKFYKTETGYKP